MPLHYHDVRRSWGAPPAHLLLQRTASPLGAASNLAPPQRVKPRSHHRQGREEWAQSRGGKRARGAPSLVAWFPLDPPPDGHISCRHVPMRRRQGHLRPSVAHTLCRRPWDCRHRLCGAGQSSRLETCPRQQQDRGHLDVSLYWGGGGTLQGWPGEGERDSWLR